MGMRAKKAKKEKLTNETMIIVKNMNISFDTQSLVETASRATEQR